jgi:hypothetical protein
MCDAVAGGARARSARHRRTHTERQASARSKTAQACVTGQQHLASNKAGREIEARGCSQGAHQDETDGGALGRLEAGAHFEAAEDARNAADAHEAHELQTRDPRGRVLAGAAA